MKQKIWLFQIPIVGIMTFLFFTVSQFNDGKAPPQWIGSTVLPALRSLNGWVTNAKFKLRGPEAPDPKIVIVEVDSPALEHIGRWPWHRNYTAFLIDKIFSLGAKVVGLDMVFSEPDRRVSDEIEAILKQYQLAHVIPELETDHELAKVIQAHKDKLVLGWATELNCIPRFSNAEDCPIDNPDYIDPLPPGMERYAVNEVLIDGQARPQPITQFSTHNSPLINVLSFINNIPLFTDPSIHGAYFNAVPDDDGYIRRAPLIMKAHGHYFPGLSLAMARAGLQEELQISLGNNENIQSVTFKKSGRKIPVSASGAMEINFRGPAYTFQYVSALSLMTEEDTYHISNGRAIASVDAAKIQEIFKDAYVFVGVSALGVFDMRAFPFETNTPGVEGHAHILDNLLKLDMMHTENEGNGRFWLLLLMTVGALLFAYLTEKFESVPALLLCLFALGGFGWVDLKILFENHHNWNTSLVYLQFGVIFITTLAAKYVIEERNKKFIKGAFAKYVAPAIVDSIIKDPTKLTVGGTKKDLTILFSDIRSFTTFSEQLDAKRLSQFLNEYLGTMTDIVFETEGTLDKYIGDAVMAFWGAPLDQPRHALNACRAAIKMQQLLKTEKVKFKTEYGIDVAIGIGINSGPVSVGNMGSERIFEYTVIGDHVNLASRLEGLTKYYGVGIVTTRFTFDLIEKIPEPLPPHRVLDFVKVKGKKQAVELIQLLESDLSPEGLQLFEQARQLYTQQKWDEAIEKFKTTERLLGQNPDELDAPSTMYIERCNEFKQNPPDADWDGSWVMTSK